MSIWTHCACERLCWSVMPLSKPSRDIRPVSAAHHAFSRPLSQDIASRFTFVSHAFSSHVSTDVCFRPQPLRVHNLAPEPTTPQNSKRRRVSRSPATEASSPAVQDSACDVDDGLMMSSGLSGQGKPTTTTVSPYEVSPVPGPLVVPTPARSL